MNEANFHERADDILSSVMDAIEIADSTCAVEADLIGGVLTIAVNGGGGEYVINKHEPTRQIWMSSPQSGASHFTYNTDDNEWTNGDGRDFKDKLSIELARIANIDVEF